MKNPVFPWFFGVRAHSRANPGVPEVRSDRKSIIKTFPDQVGGGFEGLGSEHPSNIRQNPTFSWFFGDSGGVQEFRELGCCRGKHEWFSHDVRMFWQSWVHNGSNNIEGSHGSEHFVPR